VPSALITGITGQDGSYLAELLVAKGYEVHGIVRHSSTSSTERIGHLGAGMEDGVFDVHLHDGDLTDGSRLTSLIRAINPDEIYNLGAVTHVGLSFDEPELTGNVTGLGSTRMLEALRLSGVDARFYQASSSEMFGASPPPQNEATALMPRSPYAAAKVYAHWMTRNYREAYGLFACSGILFNHESPRRGEAFVTRKIAKAAARIAAGRQDKLYLGNLDAVRDWGYAPEYVEAMWLMLQSDEPDDYVVATGVGYTVRDFSQASFAELGLNWEDHVEFDTRYTRPTEPADLVGDATKAELLLGWKAKTLAPEIARIMVASEVTAVAADPSIA
jgi:GDPmannose 4,6-dehydratase